MSANFVSIVSEFNLNGVSTGKRVVYVFDAYRLDRPRRMLYRGARELVLPLKSLETLIALIEQRGEIVAKDDLMDIIWPDTVVEEGNLTHHISVLRKTLGRNISGKPFIETLRGRGYRFTSDVRVIEEAKPANGNGKYPHLVEVGRRNPVETTKGPTWPVVREAAGETDKSKKTQYLLPLIALSVAAFLVALGAIGYFQWQAGKEPANGIVERGEISVTQLTNGSAVLDATISPDGKYFVYHEQTENTVHVWLQQVGQSGRLEIVPPRQWTIGGKAFSPNGEFIYFHGRENENDKFSLYRVPTLGGPLTRILTDIASPVTFSADGREIAFVRQTEGSGESQLIKASAEGGSEKSLLTRSGGQVFSYGNAWSPDGKYIAFGALDLHTPGGEGLCTIAVLDLQTGAVKDLSSERWDTCFRMAWTPNGDGLVFIGTRSGESYTTRRDQVYYLSAADGRSRRISTDGSRYQSSSLGIAYNSLLAVPHKRLSQIWVLNADGDSTTGVQLTNGQLDGNLGIAPLPDGRIGYVSRIGENLALLVMNADGSNQHQIGLQLPFVEELRSTPDGRYFIFSARRDGFSHLYRIGIDGDDITQLTFGESHEVSSTISPDSQWVYYGSNITGGGAPRTIFRKTSVDGRQTFDIKEMETSGLIPSLSPDGKLIAGPASGRLQILSSSDGTPIDSLKIDKRAEFYYGGAKWTPDGQSLAYQAFGNNSVNVWVQPVNGSAPRQLTNFPKGYVYFHTFSPDGSKLYVARGQQIRDAVLIKNFE